MIDPGIYARGWALCFGLPHEEVRLGTYFHSSFHSAPPQSQGKARREGPHGLKYWFPPMLWWCRNQASMASPLFGTCKKATLSRAWCLRAAALLMLSRAISSCQVHLSLLLPSMGKPPLASQASASFPQLFPLPPTPTVGGPNNCGEQSAKEQLDDNTDARANGIRVVGAFHYRTCQHLPLASCSSRSVSSPALSPHEIP